MFDSFADLFPANWRPAILILTSPFRWLAGWQGFMMRWTFGHDQTIGFLAGEILLIVPVLLIFAGTWSSAASRPRPRPSPDSRPAPRRLRSR